MTAIDASSDSRWASGALATFDVQPGSTAEIVLDAPRLRRVTLRIAGWSELRPYLRPSAVWIRESVWKLADGSVSVLYEEPWPGTLRFTCRGAPSGEVAVPLDPGAREILVEIPKELIERWR